MSYQINKIIRMSILFFASLLFTSACAAEQSAPLKGFAFKVTDSMPKQGMLYGPLDKDVLYTITCKIDNANTEQDIRLTICHDGTADDNNICSKDAKKIAIKLNKSSTSSAFSFTDLKPLKLNSKWRKALKANYIVELDVEGVEQLAEDKYISGSCNIEPQQPAAKSS